MAGPFGDPDGVKRGLFIFNVDSLDEARELVQSDPAVAAGIFEVELIDWYGSAALMEVNQLHQRLQKTAVE